MTKKLRRAVRNAFVKSVIFRQSGKRKRAIQSFADKLGLVNFGYVNQNLDAHKAMRGFTISASHHDENFCVGSVREYDIELVDRSDAVWQNDESIVVFKWLILSFKLKTEKPLPNLFIKAKNIDANNYNTLSTVYPYLKSIEMGVFEDYPTEFINRYEVLAKPSDSVETQRLLPADTARVFAAHFWPLSIECSDNILYIYSTSINLSGNLLDTIIENGLWLAGHLDSQIENI